MASAQTCYGRGLDRTCKEQGNVRIDAGFRADPVVEDRVIVGIKSVELLLPVHRKQLLTYLRLADKRLGLLINFHVALIKDGITRIVNGLEEDDHTKSLRRVGYLDALSLGFQGRRPGLSLHAV